MKFKHFRKSFMSGVLFLVTVAPLAPAIAQTAPTQTAPTAITNPVDRSFNEEQETKLERAASKENHQKLVNENAQKSPYSPAEIDAEVQKLGPSHRAKALKQALSQLGTKENPPGSNCQKYSTYFGHGCEYWCADFVSWAFDTTGNGDRKLPWGNPSAVSSIIAWGIQGHEVKTPQPGDIFTIKGHGASHTGIVRKVTGGSFTSVEGNADNRVESLSRSINQQDLRFFRFGKD
jgi:CHAP domain